VKLLTLTNYKGDAMTVNEFCLATEAEKQAFIERLKCESDQPGWCEVCAVVYEEEDPCQFH
jgi:hypothetical protein